MLSSGEGSPINLSNFIGNENKFRFYYGFSGLLIMCWISRFLPSMVTGSFSILAFTASLSS